jgi:hypothetical protein
MEPVAENEAAGNSQLVRKQYMKAGRKDKFMSLTLEVLPWRDAQLSLFDARVVTKQLGYVPYNLVHVGRHINLAKEGGTDSRGSPVLYPAVTVLYPLNANDLDGRYSKISGLKPFPTTIWMSCPHLHARISKLEEDGLITEFEDRMNNEEFVSNMRHAHECYKQFRWSLLSSRDIELITSSGWYDSVDIF